MIGFSAHQYTLWMWHSKQMAAESVSRAEASGHIREVCLALTGRHRMVLFPAALMLIGGFICLIAKRTNDETKD
jgi:hypothetical protein